MAVRYHSTHSNCESSTANRLKPPLQWDFSSYESSTANRLKLPLQRDFSSYESSTANRLKPPLQRDFSSYELSTASRLKPPLQWDFSSFNSMPLKASIPTFKHTKIGVAHRVVYFSLEKGGGCSLGKIGRVGTGRTMIPNYNANSRLNCVTVGSFPNSSPRSSALMRPESSGELVTPS